MYIGSFPFRALPAVFREFTKIVCVFIWIMVQILNKSREEIILDELCANYVMVKIALDGPRRPSFLLDYGVGTNLLEGKFNRSQASGSKDTNRIGTKLHFFLDRILERLLRASTRGPNFGEAVDSQHKRRGLHPLSMLDESREPIASR